MNITRYYPWNWFDKENGYVSTQRSEDLGPSIIHMHREIDRIFRDIWHELDTRSPVGMRQTMLMPKIDITETDKEYLIKVEVPGVDEKDLKLQSNNNCLVIQGEKKQEMQDKSEHFYRNECVYGKFKRVLNLPEDVDPNTIDAKFKSGVLIIKILRKEAFAEKMRIIPVNVDKLKDI